MFADIAAPLNALTSEKIAFEWDENCELSFQKLKELLCSHPVLKFPMLGERFVLEVDASDYAIGESSCSQIPMDPCTLWLTSQMH